MKACHIEDYEVRGATRVLGSEFELMQYQPPLPGPQGAWSSWVTTSPWKAAPAAFIPHAGHGVEDFERLRQTTTRRFPSLSPWTMAVT